MDVSLPRLSVASSENFPKVVVYIFSWVYVTNCFTVFINVVKFGLLP